MRHLRWALAGAVILALCASSPAAAGDSHHGDDPILAPANGHVLAEWYKTLNELPAPLNPRWGSGEDPCVTFGTGGKMLVAISFGEVTCTAEQGTVVMTGGAHFCSSFDPIDSPFYAVGRIDQRRCAEAVSQEETGVRVSVDNGPWVDLFQPQYTTVSPQTTVRLPVDNVWGVPAQTATITAYGWNTIIRNLRVGRHHYTTSVQFAGDDVWYPFEHDLIIVPRGHAGNG